MKIEKILVPVDFSPFSDKAVQYALFLAEKFEAEITLLHTVLLFQEDINEEEHMKAYEGVVRRRLEERSAQLDIQRKTVETRGIRVRSELLRGISAADTILDYIFENEFDLVVLGTHGRTGLRKWISGSVAERIVRLSPIPVMTIQKNFKKTTLKKILVPVDFSTHANFSVDRAQTLSSLLDADLVYLHSIEVETLPDFNTVEFDSIFDLNPDLRSDMIKRMRKFADTDDEKIQFIVTEGKAHKAIKKYADENDIDLIIMGTRGTSDLEHFLTGSNTERVVRIAPCPVLTVGRKL